MKFLLQRLYSSDQGTVGVLRLPISSIFILELPERNNASQISRIPEGSYEVKWSRSPRFGYCYHLTGVSSRGNILIHSGNFAGDTTCGYTTHTHGCLLPAMKIGRMGGQLAGLLSGVALKKLYEVTNKQDFTLEIRNA